jgi:peptide/nickel transport system substrate-binding protein
VIPDPYEGSIFFTRVKERKFDAINMGWGGGLAADPYQVWHSSQIGNGGSNYVGFNIPEADKLIEDARKEFDADKRNEMYKKFHGIIHEEQPYTFIYSRPQQRFLDKRFKNVEVHTLGLDPLEWFVPMQKQRYN